MKKVSVIFILLSILFLISCVPEITSGPGLVVKIYKQEVSVNEKIKIKVIFDEIYINAWKDFLLYVEDYPEDCEILCGQLFAEKTNEKFLCVLPEKYETTKYKMEVQIFYTTPGEHTLKINTCSLSGDQFLPLFGESYFTYKFIVTE